MKCPRSGTRGATRQAGGGDACAERRRRLAKYEYDNAEVASDLRGGGDGGCVDHHNEFSVRGRVMPSTCWRSCEEVLPVGRIVLLTDWRRSLEASALLAEAQVHRPPAERAAAGRRAAELYLAGSGSLWGYEEGGYLLGLAGVEVRDNVLWLSDLAVTPAHRRRGVGRRLIEFLCAEYPGREVEGDTVPDSRVFYEACGFQVRQVGALPSGVPLLRFRLAPGESSRSR